MILADFSPNLSMVIISSDRYAHGRFCMKTETQNVAVDPPDHPLGTIMRLSQMGFMTQMAKSEVCYFYRRCGKQYSSVTYKRGERFPEVDVLVTHHPVSDAETTEIGVRPAHNSEHKEFYGTVAQECLPAT